jgi:hypothetical protein
MPPEGGPPSDPRNPFTQNLNQDQDPRPPLYHNQGGISGAPTLLASNNQSVSLPGQR